MKLNIEAMEKHVVVLGWLYLIFGGLIISLALAAAVTPVEPDGATLSPQAVLFFVLIGSPVVLAGFGLLKRWPWIRNLVLLLAIFNLINIPIGTLLGLYTLWVLWSPEGRHIFSQE